MKSLKLLLFCLAFIAFGSNYAQEKIKVSETTEDIEGVKGNSLKVTIYRADEKTVAKEWKSTLKSKSGDVDIKGKSVIASDVLIEAISEREISVYALIKVVNETEIDFYVIFLNGDRAISSAGNPSAFVSAKKIVEDFANSVSKEAAKDNHKEEEKLLKSYNKELENVTQEIEDAKKLIKEKQKEIEDNTKKKENLLKQIEEQNKTVKASEKEIGIY